MRRTTSIAFLIVISKLGLAPVVSVEWDGDAGLAFGQPAPASLRPTDPPTFYVHPHDGLPPPHLDGKLNDPVWRFIRPIKDFYQREPKEGEPASELTVVSIHYDEHNLYFAIRCHDREPDKVVANVMRRDADLSDDDSFEIIIDTYHDHRNGYYFAFNPLGAKLDAEIRAEGTDINWNWDGIWYCKATRDKKGWAAEVQIPFKTLRFSGAPEQTWGINFARYIARKREEDYWTPIPRDYGPYGKFQISRFGHLVGLRNLHQSTRLQIKPYTVGGMEKDYRLPSNRLDHVIDLGLDVKYGITSNLTADLTLNTDFAQVEADREQINLTRFDLYYPEKRDFFLEGADIFRFGERLDPYATVFFFSRRIGLSQDGSRQIPMLGGIKITGKEGSYDLGFLNVLTDPIAYADDYGDFTRVPRTNFSVLRVKRDILTKSSIGFIAMSKDEPRQRDYRYNRGFGADWRLSFLNNLRTGGFLAKTVTPGITGRDWAASVDFSWGNDLWNVDLGYTDIQENFNAEMGFIQRIGVRKSRATVTFSPRPKLRPIRQSYLYGDLQYITDQRNALQTRNLFMAMSHLLADGGYLTVGVYNTYDRLDYPFAIRQGAVVPARIYRSTLGTFRFYSDESRRLSWKVRLSGGGYLGGTIRYLYLAGRVQPSGRLGLSMEYEWNGLDLPIPNGVFTTNLLGARLTYSFSPELFMKLFVQWNDFDRIIVTNFLVNFIHTPGSDFYLVFNERRDTNGSHLWTRDRAALAKLTYLFHF